MKDSVKIYMTQVVEILCIGARDRIAGSVWILSKETDEQQQNNKRGRPQFECAVTKQVPEIKRELLFFTVNAFRKFCSDPMIRA